MDLDRTWGALTRPGNASDHFDLDPTPPFEPVVAGYSPVNAWWLSELSRLAYRGSTSRPAGDEILARADLEQLHEVRRGSIHCALIAPRGGRDRPFAVLAFRGTSGIRNWLTNFHTIPRAWPRGGLVHVGFQAAVDAVWSDVEPHLAAVDAPVFYAGHSLGAALATVAASLRPPRALYTFGSPRVGDTAFVDSLGDVPVYRIVHHADIVPTVPPSRAPLRFRHAGELCYITHDGCLFREPGEAEVATDRRRPRRPIDGERERRSWNAPSDPFSDHAPVNYTARLERLLP